MDGSLANPLSGLVATLGHSKFAQELMGTLRAATGADLVSAFQFSEFNEPIYLLGAGCSVSEARFSQMAGIKYANGYWRFDPAVSNALATGSDAPCRVLRQTWRDIPHREYRAYCYESHDVLERVSIFDRSGRTPVMLNLYRYKGSGHFSPPGIHVIEKLGGLFGSLVAKHAEIAGIVRKATSPASAGTAARVLRDADLGLSTQEIEVCASLLSGFSYKEIAQRRSLKTSSVVTYRKRAYLKLGVTNREQLISLFEQARSRTRFADLN